MKRHLFLAAMMIALVLVAKPVLAGGDKNRGDVGQGDVEQHQVEWDEYASQRLVQNQELVLTQTQLQSRVQTRTQWPESRLADLWY